MENNYIPKCCYNCDFPLQEKHKYCPNCGQKHATGRVGLRTLISDFFVTNFNFDTRAIRTLKGLLIPGFLTTAYFKGIHKKYNTPVQLFLVLSLILFTIFSYKSDGINFSNFNLNELVLNDEARINLLGGNIDTLDLNNDGPVVQFGTDNIIPDSVKDERIDIQLFFINFAIEKDSIEFDGKRFAVEAFKNINPKSFVNENFSEAPFYRRLILTQSLKMGFEGDSLFRFLLLRSPILILFSLPIFAFLQQLLYVRRPFYFVEHLIFQLHFLCFITLGLIPYVGFNLNEGDFYAFCATIGLPLYLLFAIKSFYKQGWFKTILKFILSSFLGLIALVLSFLFILGISILIF